MTPDLPSMPGPERARIVHQSLEDLAERVGDPADRIYARLFDFLPDTQALFIADTAGIVRHEMLARAFETVLDLVDEGRVARGLLLSEYVNHQQIGVPTGGFEVFSTPWFRYCARCCLINGASRMSRPGLRSWPTFGRSWRAAMAG